ncbi:hypothetical protein HGM15179_000304 [Zosterops borbonicus]|uniref:Uncharacterized protein n=1 Tax=Zosterops borbonicus TaxID=364589 RepID=A0A8K1GWN5_9PASS|nr:hypothetical protein HGM15179_000304 [Zosterops borbonicus]
MSWLLQKLTLPWLAPGHPADQNLQFEESRKFLARVEDNFLLQLMIEHTRGGIMLDMLFVNGDGLVGDVVVGGCLGHNDHEIIEFLIFGEIRRNINKKSFTMNFERVDLGL